MSRQQIETDNGVAAAKRARAQQEKLARMAVQQAKAHKDAVIAKRRALDDLEREANAMTPLCTLQTLVSSKLTTRTTEDLGRAARFCAYNRNKLVPWLSPSLACARDVMQRAYPLSLQLGIICTIDDTRHRLIFTTGSVIDFRWPGKEDKPAAIAAKPTEEDPA